MNDQDSSSNNSEDIIGTATSIDEIISALSKRGCSDLTASISPETSEIPYANGAFCDVYQGMLKDGTKIAIKSLRVCDGPGADIQRKKVFKHAALELYHWSKLRHKNVLPLLGLTRFHGRLAMVSEWMGNGTISSFLHSNPDTNRFYLCMDICAGLCYIHGEDMVHGDLKAANVLVSSRGIAMISDFGCARLKDLTIRFSNTGKPAFTIRWAAPELLLYDDAPQTKEVDVYAFGMTVLEVLTGKLPFEGINDNRVIVKVISEKTHPPRPKSGVSDSMWKLLLSCWAHSPARRPSSMDIREQLQAIDEAISSAHSRLAARLCIPRPPSWESRHKWLGKEWHGEHKDKTFHTLQYWKCQVTPWHEFIVLRLNDGSVCRIERMGEVAPGRQQDALHSNGIPASDFVQVFPYSNTPKFSTDAGLIAVVQYPREFKLMEVLDICYTIKLNSDTKLYTLQCFNCYFFAWTIILVLGRQTAEWDQAFAEDRWDSMCKNITEALEAGSQLPDRKLAFKLEKILSAKNPSDDNVIITAVDQHMRQKRQSLLQQSRSLLWTKEAPSCIIERLGHWLRDMLLEDTFSLLYPGVDNWSLLSRISTEAIPWGRDQVNPVVPTRIRQETGADPRPHLLRGELQPPSPSFQLILSKLVEGPMFEAFNTIYRGVATIAQPSAGTAGWDPWVIQLDAYIRTATAQFENHNTTLEKQFSAIIDSYPEVNGPMWREALIRLCSDQVLFFRSSPLPQLWGRWLWDAIGEEVSSEVESAIPQVEPTNLKITCTGQVDEWINNQLLQNYIEGRIEEHCAMVYCYTRKPMGDLKHEIMETIEGIWERFQLGDQKHGFGAICQPMKGLWALVACCGLLWTLWFYKTRFESSLSS